MKKINILLLTVCFSLFAISCDKKVEAAKSNDSVKAELGSISQPYITQVKYDKFKDVTDLRLENIELSFFNHSVGYKKLSFSILTHFKGADLSQNVSEYLVAVQSISAEKTDSTFALEVKADDARFSINASSTNADFDGKNYYETSFYKVSREQMEKIAKTSSTDLRIGGYECSVYDKDLDAVKNFVKATSTNF